MIMRLNILKKQRQHWYVTFEKTFCGKTCLFLLGSMCVYISHKTQLINILDFLGKTCEKRLYAPNQNVVSDLRTIFFEQKYTYSKRKVI
jgi:hypothetical protein